MTKEFVRKVMSWDWTEQPIPTPTSKKINKLPPMVGPVLDIPPHPTFALPETGFEWLEMPTESVTQNAVDAADGQGSELDTECTTGKCPSCEIITGDMLKDVFNKATDEQLCVVAEELNYAINFGELDSHIRLCHFLGQCKHESGGKVLATESFIYSVEGLKSTFTYYENNPDLAAEHGYTDRNNKSAAKQEDIANTAYYDPNRSEDRKLGNDMPGDGWKYRGRGIKQVTGKYNYTEFTDYHKSTWGDDIDFVTNPDLIATDAKYSVRAALWYWLSNNVAQKADAGVTDPAIRSVTIAINGGTKGLAERQKYTSEIFNSKVFENVCFNKTNLNSNNEAKEPK